MNEIIDNGASEPAIVKVGDGQSNLSIKTYQDVYHQITGRTEKISKRSKEHILVTIDDVTQLHHKMWQLCDVHNIVAKNEAITIFYDQERTEQYTSFERFQRYNANATSPCINLVLKYNFSIIPGGLQRPQEYVVTIRLTSRLGLIKQADEEDAPSFMRGFFFDRERTTEVSIEYADYVVARGFMEAFDEWLKGVKKSRRNPLVSFMAPRTHYITGGLKLLGAFSVSLFALQAIPELFSPATLPTEWARFFVIYMGGGYCLLNLLGLAGAIIENAIENYPTLSYVHLNRGDAHLIEEFRSQRRPVVWKFLWGSVFAIILGVIASRLDKLI